MSSNDVSTEVVFLAIAVLGALVVFGLAASPQPAQQNDEQEPSLVQFDSQEEYSEYVNDYARTSERYTFVLEDSTRRASDEAASASLKTGTSDIGKTNTQVRGVQEPDVLKTNGDITAFSRRDTFFPTPGARFERPPRFDSETEVLDTSDPRMPRIVEQIDMNGQMLLEDENLVIYNRSTIAMYDISNSTDPTEQWSRSLRGDRLTSARLTQGTLYVVSSTPLLYRSQKGPEPCPVEPVEGTTISCDSIFRPEEPTAVTHTVSAISMNVNSGETIDSVAFLAEEDQSEVVFVSDESIYVATTDELSSTEAGLTAMLEQDEVSLPATSERRIQDVLEDETLNRTERNQRSADIIESISETLSEEEFEELSTASRNTIQERVSLFAPETDITKVSYEDGELEVEANGEVLGRPHGQFAFNENDGLQVATEIDREATDNRMYTLNETLSVEGVVTGLAPEQDIFAVRYVEERAYLITFEQIDPFHVVDFSYRENPEELGQVELPGVSEYLHPLGEQRFLGVGSERGNVKLTLFDASDPQEPQVSDSLVLDARSSSALQTHRAFRYDASERTAFIPTTYGGVLVSNDGEELSVEATIETDFAVSRLTYIGDTVYLFGNKGFAVADRETGEVLVRGEF